MSAMLIPVAPKSPSNSMQLLTLSNSLVYPINYSQSIHTNNPDMQIIGQIYLGFEQSP